MSEARADVVVVGGGVGGVAAALGALRRGATVLLSHEEEWIGGQLTAQMVPPDEHPWVETMGVTASYRRFRDGVRAHYRREFPLTADAAGWEQLNPGAGKVSKLCHEPRVALAVLQQMLAPYKAGGALRVLPCRVPVAAEADGDHVLAVTVESPDGDRLVMRGDYFVDATELGDLLPLAGAEYVTGSEAQADSGEPSAGALARPDNLQAFAVCLALDHVDGDHTIDRPARYDHWRTVQPEFWGAPLLSWIAPHPRTLAPLERSLEPNPAGDPRAVLADEANGYRDENLWTFRRIRARKLFRDGDTTSDVTVVNWPMIDYFEGSVVDVDTTTAATRLEDARQLTLSALYWMQTEAPRGDGGVGYPGLRPRPDISGTPDGLAQAAYHREGRRIRALTTVAEHDVSLAVRGEHGATRYRDSAGIGMYRIDLHPSTGGDNYIDVGVAPFEVPLGTLIPQRMRNLLAGAKNIGSTHITNGCYRLHPVEWNIGESAGILAAECVRRGWQPHQVQADDRLLGEFQAVLTAEGLELHWPEGQTGY